MKEWLWIALGVGIGVGLLLLATQPERESPSSLVREPAFAGCQATVRVEGVRVASNPGVGDEWSHYIRIEDGDWLARRCHSRIK